MASTIGVQRTVTTGGGICLIAALVFLFRIKSLRVEALPLLRYHGISSGDPATDTNPEDDGDSCIIDDTGRR